jgi:hypothetical protein
MLLDDWQSRQAATAWGVSKSTAARRLKDGAAPNQVGIVA